MSNFDTIKINKFNLNKGFHGLEIPRSKELYFFLRNKLKIKFNLFELKRKMLINRVLIDFKLKKSQWPEEIKKNLRIKKNFYKNQKINFFFKNELVKLFRSCGKRYSDNIDLSKSQFLPWFLPADVKHLSSDEGDIYRYKVRNNKLSGNFAIPTDNTFRSLQNKFYRFLIKRGVKFLFNTHVHLNKKEIFFYNNNQTKISLIDRDTKKIFYCLNPTFLIKDINKNHFKKIYKFKRHLMIGIIKINENFDNNFSEILCANKKIPFLNKIYSLNFLKYKIKKNSYIVVEIQNKSGVILDSQKNLITKEIKKIFKLNKEPAIIDIKKIRDIYKINNDWIEVSNKILKKNFNKKTYFVYKNDYWPINMTKAWLYANKNSIKD
jgi:hypothetical protein